MSPSRRIVPWPCVMRVGNAPCELRVGNASCELRVGNGVGNGGMARCPHRAARVMREGNGNK